MSKEQLERSRWENLQRISNDVLRFRSGELRSATVSYIQKDGVYLVKSQRGRSGAQPSR